MLILVEISSIKIADNDDVLTVTASLIMTNYIIVVGRVDLEVGCEFIDAFLRTSCNYGYFYVHMVIHLHICMLKEFKIGLVVLLNNFWSL